MARKNQLFVADSYADLVSAVNTFLATLPLGNQTIHGFQIEVQDEDSYTGLEIICNLVYDDAAGAAIANPFTIRADSDHNAATLTSTLNAVYAAAPAQLFIPVATTQKKNPLSETEYTIITLQNAVLAAGANVSFP